MKKKIISKFFSFFRRCCWPPLINIHSRISLQIFEKIWNGPNGIPYSGARGTLIYEKNLMSKISCQTPLKKKEIKMRSNQWGRRLEGWSNTVAAWLAREEWPCKCDFVCDGRAHGPNNYKDTHHKCRFYWCLIEFFRLQIQSVMLVFSMGR
jgi:hypothetical protein